MQQPNISPSRLPLTDSELTTSLAVSFQGGLMRWYVSRNGESSGPHDEALVAQWARNSELAGAMLRDEAASAWVPVSQTPFAALEPTASPPVAPVKPATPELSPLAKIGFVVVGSLFVTYYFVTRNEKVAGSSPPPPEQSPIAAAATPESAPAAPTAPDATAAWVTSKEFVKRQLKSPGSAEFGSPFSGEFQKPDEHCKAIEGGAWVCTGWVDAQNEFSAKIRADFTVTVKPDIDGSWRALSGPTLVQR